MKQIRKDKNARPGSQIKLAIQNKLHKSTYQGSSGIDNCVKLMGVSNFWQQTCKGLQESAKPEDAQEQINKIVQRRNAIVHEADLPRRISAQTIKCNEIKYKDAKNYVKFIRDFVTSANEVFEAST